MNGHDRGRAFGIIERGFQLPGKKKKHASKPFGNFGVKSSNFDIEKEKAAVILRQTFISYRIKTEILVSLL